MSDCGSRCGACVCLHDLRTVSVGCELGADFDKTWTCLSQYEAAPPNTITDFMLVNKRASTVNAIAIDALLRRHKESVLRIDLSYNYLRNSELASFLPWAEQV